MSKLQIHAHASVDYDAAIVALANHRAIYWTTATRPTREQAQLAIESVFTMSGERGLDTWMTGGKDHDAWAQEQVDRLWPDLRPPATQRADSGMTCTPACWTPVPCGTCGRDLPPCGRDVGNLYVADCCDNNRMSSRTNPRHLWGEHDSVRHYVDPVGWAAHEEACATCRDDDEDAA